MPKGVAVIKKTTILLCLVVFPFVIQAQAQSTLHLTQNSVVKESSEFATVFKALLNKLEYLELKLSLQRGNYTSTSTPQTILSLGSRGADVVWLQRNLITIIGAYPEEIVSGYYGSLTQQAVQRVQARYGLQVNGRLDPATAQVINSRIERLGRIQSGTEKEPVVDLEAYPHASVAVEDEYADNNSLSQLALMVQERVNDLRSDAGLSDLKWASDLASIAYNHSRDQRKDNVESLRSQDYCHYPFIRHEGSRDFSLINRLDRAGNITYTRVGENIAMVPTFDHRTFLLRDGLTVPDCPDPLDFTIEEPNDFVEYFDKIDAFLEGIERNEDITFLKNNNLTQSEVADLIVNGWFNSVGHKENMLNQDFTYGGVGITEIGDYVIVTHNLGRL